MVSDVNFLKIRQSLSGLTTCHHVIIQPSGTKGLQVPATFAPQVSGMQLVHRFWVDDL